MQPQPSNQGPFYQQGQPFLNPTQQGQMVQPGAEIQMNPYQQPVYAINGQVPMINQPVFVGAVPGMVGVPQPLPFQANEAMFPIQIICPNCKNQVMTFIRPEIGGGTYLASCILCFFTGIFCCWVPCVMQDCKDKVHYCPSCNAEVGIRPYVMC